MDSARYERIQTLFHEAAALPDEDRRAFLETASNGDRELVDQVWAMLVEDARGSLLDRDLGDVAKRLFDPGASAALPRREFGRYRITDLLGEGGMGVVYRAERPDLGSVAAIKILRDAWLSPARRERFASEQRTLAQLNHPSIARLYDADTLADGTPWFVMEFVEGVPLSEYCATQASSTSDRLRLFREVCDAVRYAHSQHVIHRDLKPSNILVTTAGRVKLLDFGISKQIAELDVPADVTRTALRMMTPAYAAPEQIQGGRATVGTDIYSLGVILYELLAGRLPFDVSGRTPAEAEAMILQQEPEKPSVAARPVAKLEADLDVLCLTAMHKDPGRRYPSVDALMSDVDRYLNGEPLSAQPDSVTYRAIKFVRRNRRLLAIAATVFVLGVGLAWVGGRILSRPPSTAGSVSTAAAKTVAILPFQNMSANHDLDFLSVALPNEIATTLSHSRALSVRPFATASRYDPANLDVQRAGRELRASTIVTGHFLKAGPQLQITLEAIDVETTRSFWRESVSAAADSLIAAHMQLAARTREGLAPALGATSTDSTAPPRNEEAYDLFLRSMALPLEVTTNQPGIQMLERSVALDPSYAPAWHSLSRRYYIESHYKARNVTATERYRASAEHAVAIDPSYVPAAAGLIGVRVERGDLVGAYQAAQDLVRRRPDSVDARFSLSYVFRYAGLLNEAADQCEAAFLIDPKTQTTGLRSCAVVFILRGDYSRAMKYLSLELGSDLSNAFTIQLLVRQHKEQEALRVQRPNIPGWSFDLLLACAAATPPSAISAMAAAVRPLDDPEMNYFSSTHLAYCGQTDSALQMLKKTIEGGYCAAQAMNDDPLFDRVRMTTQFNDVRSAAAACQNNFLAQR